MGIDGDGGENPPSPSAEMWYNVSNADHEGMRFERPPEWLCFF